MSAVAYAPQIETGPAVGTVHVVKGRRTPSALIDIPGLKCAGLVPADELHLVEDGDQVEVLVIDREGEDGFAVVSVRQLEAERAWTSIARDVADRTLLTFQAERVIKGGVIGQCAGLEAFLPASRANVKRLHQLARLVGKDVEVVAVEAERERGNIIVSQVEAIATRKAEAIKDLQVGEIYTLPVEGLADFGAFLDLGNGVAGLLHASELTWQGGRQNPSDHLEVGQHVTVRLLDISTNKKGTKISFSKRRVWSAWDEAAEDMHAGEVVDGRVINVKAGLGAFVALGNYPRVVGLLRNEDLQKGDDIRVTLVSFDVEKQRARLELAD